MGTDSAARPSNPDGRAVAMSAFARAVALQRQGRHAEALPFFWQAVQGDPRAYDPWANLCAALLKTGDYNMASRAATVALSIQPGFAPAWVLKAQTLWKLSCP